MLLLLRLAFRNLARNKRRTIISGLAIGLGLASLIVYDALIIGMKENMIAAATNFFPGHAQIHKKGFRRNLEVSDYIENPGKIMRQLDGEGIVMAYAPRVISFAMLSSAADVSSVMLYGIDPEREKKISRIREAMAQGDFLGPLDESRILLGETLAKNLSVGIGDRLVLTLAQAETGDLSQELFRVGGIYSFKIREMDSNVAFINIAKAQSLLAIGKSIHEIAITFTDIKLASSENLPFWAKYSQGGNEAEGWNKLFHDLDSLMKMSQFALLLSSIILFGIVSLGIINTLFMSIHERIFEFGVLRAIGTSPSRMAMIVIFEACALALISIVIGMILGYIFGSWLAATGIDYRGYEFNKVTIKEMLYPVLTVSQFIVYPAVLFIFTALIGLYPAIYTARLIPAKAMRRGF